MRFLSWLVLTAIAFLARSDVTIRYRSETEPSMAFLSGMADSCVRMKDGKGLSTIGSFTMILDFSKLEMTLIDNAGKTFATMPAAEYGKKVSAAMPGGSADPMEGLRSMFGSVKTKNESRKTGRTSVIQGIQAEERESMLSVEMPMSGQGQPMTMKMVSHTWTAVPEEALRVPAIRELTALNLWMKYFGSFPNAFLGEPSPDTSVILRMEMAMQMSGPGLSADAAPMFRCKMEVVELSTAGLDEALFRIPKDYREAAVEDLMRGLAGHMRTEPASAPPPTGVEAFVPMLSPLEETEPEYPATARAQGVQGTVQLLVTVDTQGRVMAAEALAGPEALRQPALAAVRQWKYRPVIRNGKPVTAYTEASVDFFDPDKRTVALPNIAEQMAATERIAQLKKQFPRSEQVVLADLEQNSQGRDAMGRFYALDHLAYAALAAGETDKAVAYADEALAGAQEHADDWNAGNAVHHGHTVRGLAALRQGDVAKAAAELLASGQTKGSPQLGSFGPNMTLAKALLEKGESGVVLEFLALCRDFWKMGGPRLDAWSQAIRDGKTPNFSMNLR